VKIESAATFTMDFVKQLEWFQTIGIKRVLPGAVLYNGEQPFSVRGVRVLNPLHVEDIWKTLTEPSEKKALISLIVIRPFPLSGNPFSPDPLVRLSTDTYRRGVRNVEAGARMQPGC